MSRLPQLEIIETAPYKKEPESPKKRMGILGENMREFVKAPEGKSCAKCGKPLEKGLGVVKLAPLLPNGRPDVDKIEYFHNQNSKSCLD